MSTSVKSFFLLFAVVFLIIGSKTVSYAQEIDIKMSFDQSDLTTVRIDGKLLEGNVKSAKNWVFLKDFAGASRLAERVKNFELRDDEGKKIPVKKFGDGEFLAEREARSFAYDLDLSTSNEQNSFAHVSWIVKSNGLLMLNDLLPQFGNRNSSAKISFDLPKGWEVAGNRMETDGRDFIVEDIEDEVFLVGDQWRAVKKERDSKTVNFYSVGKWQFEDSEALAMAESISLEYAELFGKKVPDETNIFLLPFPNQTSVGRWQAETRGKNIAIISSSMPFKNQALQRLHEQLRHEIFHLWIPNRLNLLGNYAWFYEGFAVYQALKTGVWLGQIRFEDFLSTLGRAYDLHYRSTNDRSFLSLAKSRSNTVSTSVYSKGMLVAFLSDIAILQKSKGKRDIAAILRSLPYKSEGNGDRLAANDVILSVFSARPELDEIVEKYIKGSSKIDWESYLKYIGVENKGNVRFVRLRVKAKLTGKQKTLLNKLGYNRWRKFIRRPR